VGRHAEEHLRRFVKARAAGDAAGMRRWWEELVIDINDRMDGLVAAAHKGRLDGAEHELAVQVAMIRFARNLVRTFEGSSMGQLINAAKTLAGYACMDVQREAISQRGGTVASLDEGWDAPAGDERGPPAWQHAAAARAFERDEAARDASSFLDWALPQLPEGRRQVLELTFDGWELAGICEQLQITEANAYQRRSRGMKDLTKLKERYDR
jgi:DNA-directed RNA polymerase specialized sigma24 family protein